MDLSIERKVIEPVKKVKKISVIDAVAIVTGMVIGPGIFKTPSIVAANTGNEYLTLLLWFFGGIISLIGALCYAELSSTFPNKGGEYYYLNRSYGKNFAFLFAWARMAIIQTGSIAMLSFIIGDYASEAFNLGDYSSSIYAAITIVVLTGINLKGIYPSSNVQKILMAGIILGLTAIVVIGLFSSNTSAGGSSFYSSEFALGQAMIFILLTYGGWNEAAYLSSDLSRKKSDIVKVLFYSIAFITFVYLLTNYSLIKGLGFNEITNSETVAADLVSSSMGENWVKLISIIISVAALSTVNAVMITGARTNYALGKDFSTFKFLSNTNGNDETPVNAFLFQAAIALLLVLVGTATRNGFITMVEYTAPIFWFFFLMVGISLFVLRKKDPNKERPFTVPLYPVIPFLFCLTALFMLHSSLVYTGLGALIGISVLAAGLPFLFFKNSYKKEKKI